MWLCTVPRTALLVGKRLLALLVPLVSFIIDNNHLPTSYSKIHMASHKIESKFRQETLIL